MAGEVYPGYGITGGWVGCYTGYYPGTIPGPILSIFLRLGPTHGPMNLIYKILMRFPRYDLRMDPELTSEWTQN